MTKPPNELDARRVAMLVGKVRTARFATEDAQRAFHKAIATAVEAGAKATDVAAAAELTRQRVWQIAKERRGS
jgi:uncharacterized protein YggE